jgi:hypothetical protein
MHDHADEALAIHVLQALETAAADPKTRQLLPANVMDFMRNIQTLLQPAQTPNTLPPPDNRLLP